MDEPLPGGTLDICVNGFPNVQATGVCELGTLHISRDGGKSVFQISPKIWDPLFQNILWDLDANNDFRIAQMKVYETA